MRRRLVGARGMTAEQLVDFAASLPGYGSRGGTAMHDQYRAGLREQGYTPLDVIRARYWIRQGKPAGYRWEGP